MLANSLASITGAYISDSNSSRNCSFRRYSGANGDMKAFMHKLLVKMVNFRTIVAFSGLIFISLFGDWAVSAQQIDSLDRLFTIRELKVDETARHASEARRDALASVETEAYQKLLLKITQPEGRIMLPELSAGEIQALISGIEVVEEQSSSRRYTATLNVRFEPGLVSQFLAEYKVPHVLSTGRGVLVLHAHKDPFNEFMWMPSEAMLQAREQVDWVNRIREYVFSRGELKERAAVTFTEVRNMEARSANMIARAQDVQSVLLISTEWVLGNAGSSLFYEYRSLDGQAKGSGKLDKSFGGEEAGLLQLAYEIILDQIDSEWRSQLLVDTGEGGEFEALVPTSSGSVLSTVEKRIADVTLVGNFKILELAVPLSRIRFSYTGREEQMRLALRYAGLNIEDYGAEKMVSLRDDFVGVENE